MTVSHLDKMYEAFHSESVVQMNFRPGVALILHWGHIHIYLLHKYCIHTYINNFMFFFPVSVLLFSLFPISFDGSKLELFSSGLRAICLKTLL